MARAVPGANPFGPLYMLASALSAGLCIAILVIVNQQLWEYFYYYASGTSYYYNSWSTCYMQEPNSSGNLCYYSWAAAGVGLFFALWLLFLQLCSGRNRHIPVCEVMVCLLALCWWIAAATTATVYGKNADSWAAYNAVYSNTPQNQQYAVQLQNKEGYRTSVWAMGWANVGLFAIATLLSLFDCCTARKNPPPVAEAYPQGAYVSSQPPPYQPAYQAPYYAAGPPPGAYAAPPAGAYAAPPGAYAAPPTGYPPASGAPAGYPPTT